MGNLLGMLRAIVYLKRISKAMELIAEDLHMLRQFQQDDWEAKHIKPPAKHVEIGTMDQDEINRRYRQRQEEELQV